jgi:ABC-type microcin C transport system permease subunit YejB
MIQNSAEVLTEPPLSHTTMDCSNSRLNNVEKAYLLSAAVLSQGIERLKNLMKHIF